MRLPALTILLNTLFALTTYALPTPALPETDIIVRSEPHLNARANAIRNALAHPNPKWRIHTDGSVVMDAVPVPIESLQTGSEAAHAKRSLEPAAEVSWAVSRASSWVSDWKRSTESLWDCMRAFVKAYMAEQGEELVDVDGEMVLVPQTARG